MPRRLLPVLRAAALLALVPATLPAQARGAPLPKRPAIGAAADTNSAGAYYQWGIRQIEHDPRAAANALYWASRIDPSLADALYARRLALMLSESDRTMRYLRGDRKVIRHPEVQAIDSLLGRAEMKDPFLMRGLDRVFLVELYKERVRQDVRRRGMTTEVSEADIDFYVRQFFLTTDAETRAWFASSEGRFAEAVEQYGRAIKAARKPSSGLHIERARAHVRMGNVDSSIADFNRALEILRQRDRDSTVIFYNSKSLVEHSIGMLEEGRGDTAKAREAYGRAIQEDLAYWPAHLRLADLALAQGDSATALNELELAVQVRDDDAVLHHTYALALVRANRAQDALKAARRAIALEPWYVEPRFLAGRLYDLSGMEEDAASHYRDFQARAAASDRRLEWVTKRIADLDATIKANGGASGATTASAGSPTGR